MGKQTFQLFEQAVVACEEELGDVVALATGSMAPKLSDDARASEQVGVRLGEAKRRAEEGE